MITSKALSYAAVSSAYFDKYGRTPSDDGLYSFDDPNMTDLADFFEKVFGLPPEKTMELFQAKGIKTTWSWKDLDKAAHEQAFTSAKVMNADVLQLLKDSIDKALDDGETFDEWKGKLIERLRSAGWYGPKDVIDPETGDASTVDLTTRSRLKTIYLTNMQSSYMTSRFNQMKLAAVRRPYLQYIAVIDDATTDTCENINGKVVPIDGEGVRMPPFHYNCRTRGRSLGDRELERYNLTVHDHNAFGDHRPMDGFDVAPGTAWKPDTSQYSPEIGKALKAELAKGH